MKTTMLFTFLLAVPALAGTSQPMTEPPPPVQDAWGWFVGGTGGYLFDLDEDMYTLQIGAESPWSVAGWSVALFAEVGWTEDHHNVSADPPLTGSLHTDLEIFPITFNAKLEKMFSGGLGIYAGGGLGASYVDGFIATRPDEDDWVFTGQVFAGLTYHVSDQFEIFAGGRWIYFEDSDISGVDFGDDWLVEGGVRFHF